VALICQSIPGHFLSGGDVAGAARVLTALAEKAGEGWLPTKIGSAAKSPDPLTHFWFAQAAYAFLRASKDQATWAAALLPLIKRAAQGMISGKFDTTTMSDGGLLMGAAEEPMYANALWYNTLGILAEQLPLVADRAGDHFERLGGRFRRSYLKAFWCEQHACLCDTAVRTLPEHDAGDYLPPASQALNATLPFSAIPRTKQRQAIDAVRKQGQRVMGMLVGGNTVAEAAGGKGGGVRPLYLVWMAEGHVRTSDTPATAVAEAIAWLTPLQGQVERSGSLAAVYKADATGATEGGKPDGPTTAEFARVWRWLRETSEKPLGNSKRTRIAD
jgi:hypothetical protein